MRDHLSWKTTYFWQMVLHFSAIEPVIKDHLSWETTFLCLKGWSFKTGSTVLTAEVWKAKWHTVAACTYFPVWFSMYLIHFTLLLLQPTDHPVFSFATSTFFLLTCSPYTQSMDLRGIRGWTRKSGITWLCLRNWSNWTVWSLLWNAMALNWPD